MPSHCSSFIQLLPYTREKKINDKSFSDWSDQLLYQWFAKLMHKEPPRLQRCWVIGSNPKERWTRRPACHESIAAVPGCFLMPPEAWRLLFVLVKYMVIFHVWRGLLTLQSNLQGRAGLRTRGRRACKGGRQCPSVLVWNDLGRPTSDQEGESTFYCGKYVNLNWTIRSSSV